MQRPGRRVRVIDKAAQAFEIAADFIVGEALVVLTLSLAFLMTIRSHRG